MESHPVPAEEQQHQTDQFCDEIDKLTELAIAAADIKKYFIVYLFTFFTSFSYRPSTNQL